MRSLQSDVTSIQSDLKRVQASVVLLDGRIEHLEVSLGDLRGEVASLQNQTAELQRGVARLQSDSNEQRGVLDRIENRVDRSHAELTAMRPRMAVFENDMAGNILRVASMNARLDEHEVRLSLAERRLELRDR